MRLLLRFILFLTILLIGLAALGAYWTFYKPLPDYTGSFTMEQLQEPVDVHWDPFGVPYIYAQNEEDLYFTAGYIHAQERLWQMTLSQMAAEGRFSEFLGEDLLSVDRYQRTIGIWQTAKKIESEAPDSLIRFLEIYSAGVNQYVEENSRNLSVEFSLLDVQPIPWTPTHSIAMSRLMAWDQNVHWWSETIYGHLAETLSPPDLRELIPSYDDRFPTTLNESQSGTIASALQSFMEQELEIRNLLEKSGNNFGSNAWAVSGNKTASGQPFLSGDPHMGLSIPGFWFEMHYSSPSMTITGATIPGAPFIVLGNNENIAWTITNMMADDTDFFIEQADPDNSSRYVADSLSNEVDYRPFTYQDEIIKVKDSDDHLMRVRHTQHGPIISDIYPNEQLMDDKLISFQWMGHQVSQELWAIYRMNKAQTMQQFREAVRQFQSPAMNFIYADNQNNIALFSGAGLPVRDYNPIAFRYGWDPSYNWQGLIPFDELPHLVNPPEEFVAHANNKMHTDNYPHYLSTFWEPPSRIMRINQYLSTSDSLTVEDMQLMQYDAFSEHAREMTELILPVLRSGDEDGQFENVLSYLQNWDYEYVPNSTAASIFDTFFINLSHNILVDDIGEELYQSLIRLEHLPVMIVSRMLRDNSSFFNDADITSSSSRNDIIRMSMSQTIDQLTERFGPELFEWRWENLLSLSLQPPLLAEASGDPDTPGSFTMIVDNLFTKGPYAVRGHGMSLNKAQYSWLDPFNVTMGPSIRRIIDFSQPGRSYSVLPTGQSGNPLSSHYGDQTELWLDGTYRYIYNDSTFFDQTSFRTTTYLPN
ncbi:MAG: penicillin acylase family protein [Balneolaceae bacterium]